MDITKAIIPAAGLGTRFLPYTKAIPKEMLPLLNKPAIQYIIEEGLASEIGEGCFRRRAVTRYVTALATTTLRTKRAISIF